MNISPLFHNCPPEGELLPQEQAAFALLRTLDKVTEQLSSLAQPGDLILTVGAGDIYKVGEKLLALEAKA